MGLRKQLNYILLITGGLFLYLAYAPNLLDINPNPKSLKVIKSFEGPLKPNERLSNAEKLFNNQIVGPESLVLHQGVIYTGLETGEIIAISKDSKVTVVVKQLGAKSRPLGMRLYKDNQLLVADAYNGLLQVDINSGKTQVLLSEIDGKRFVLPDDVIVDNQGIIYFTDASTKWGLEYTTYSFLEHDKTGRVIKFDPKTKKASVVVDNIGFANGIELSHDGKSLLYSETLESRIMKYHLEGPKAGTTETFAELPGSPDNIRRSSSGGYWVALATGAINETSVSFAQRNLMHPLARKVFGRLLHSAGNLFEKIHKIYPNSLLKTWAHDIKMGKFMLSTIAIHCAILELDSSGTIVQSLQSSDKSYCLISEVLENKGQLYIGSYANPFLIKTEL